MTVPLINCQSDADADGKTGQANLKTLNRQMPFHEMPVFLWRRRDWGWNPWKKSSPLNESVFALFWQQTGVYFGTLRHNKLRYIRSCKKGKLISQIYMLWTFEYLVHCNPTNEFIMFCSHSECTMFFFFHKYNCATCIQLTCYYHPAMCEIGMLI